MPRMETQVKGLNHEQGWSDGEEARTIQEKGKEGSALEAWMKEGMAVTGGIPGLEANQEQKGRGTEGKGAAEKVASRSALRRGRGRAWTPEEDEWLLRSVEERALVPTAQGGRPMGIARAIEDIAANLDRTSVAVRARYYRLLQVREDREPLGLTTDLARKSNKEGDLEAHGAASGKTRVKGRHGLKKGKAKRGHTRAAACAVALSAVSLQEDQDSFLLGLSEFLRRAKNIRGLDLDGMVRGLARLAELAEAGTNAPAMGVRISELEQRKEDLENRVNELTSQLERVREQYRTLDYLINEFINLGSVDRVTSLGDFGRKLKYQVDQFGLVVNVKRV